MRTRIAVLSIAAFFAAGAVAVAAGTFNDAHPQTSDPAHSKLVHASWESGIGCPTGASYVDYSGNKGTYSDPACSAGGDQRDHENDGLLLAKTGPENNNAAAQVTLNNVKGIALTELGYDIRMSPNNPNEGSHCGAGSPRFEITTTDGFWEIGCSSNGNLPDSTITGDQWERLRWGSGGQVMGVQPSASYAVTPITGTVKSIQIVFDESTPGLYGPDGEGVAILDNIDVNGALVGRG